jgi:hypothetical protein
MDVLFVIFLSALILLAALLFWLGHIVERETPPDWYEAYWREREADERAPARNRVNVKGKFRRIFHVSRPPQDALGVADSIRSTPAKDQSWTAATQFAGSASAYLAWSL